MQPRRRDFIAAGGAYAILPRLDPLKRRLDGVNLADGACLKLFVHLVRLAFNRLFTEGGAVRAPQPSLNILQLSDRFAQLLPQCRS